MDHERMESWVQLAQSYFDAPHPSLAAYYRRAWVWETHTLVIDFELNGMRIGVNIDPALEGQHAVELVLRAEPLGIDWTIFGERIGSHVRVFSHDSSDDLSIAFKRIEDLILKIADIAKYRVQEISHKKNFAGSVSRFYYLNNEFTFFVANPDDAIQKHHERGSLYEVEELSMIKKYTRGARVFFDIGSNVGNHAVFMAKVLRAEKVVAFEANPYTADILKLNIALNGVGSCVDTAYLGMGVGDAEGRFTLHTPVNNLGATKLLSASVTQSAEAASEVQVAVRPLDSLQLGCMPDFVKMDVEGMEIAALNGMRRIIQKSKPLMFIEVDNVNMIAFDQWLAENDYVKVDRFKRYPGGENYMIAHRANAH